VPGVELDEEAIEGLDRLRVDEESYDRVVDESIDVYEAQETTLPCGGDRI
jgi:hypothetical protein